MERAQGMTVNFGINYGMRARVRPEFTPAEDDERIRWMCYGTPPTSPAVIEYVRQVERLGEVIRSLREDFRSLRRAKAFR